MSESLLNRIKRTTRLPSPPGAAIQILRLCQQDEVPISELADTIAADPALSLRMLKYANSAMIGASKEVTSIREAVLLLGLRSVRLMALSFSLVTEDEACACDGFDFGLYWSHSAARAVAARYLTKKLPPPPAPEEAFATALLSQIGRLVFAVSMPHQYAPVLRTCKGMLTQPSSVETERMGSSQEDLGADLILEWGIPEQIAGVIRNQNSPGGWSDKPALEKLARMVKVSSTIADLICLPLPEGHLPARWRKLAESGFFRSQKQAEEQVEEIRAEFAELSSLLLLREGAVQNAAEIQAEAGEMLDELNLATQLKSEAVEKENRGLQKKAWTDGLTGISNRAAFEHSLENKWDQCAREKKPIALIMLDVDHFKKFNDTYGHQTGDVVLQVVANCLARSVRKVDFAARYGGEEFAVIAPNVDRLTAAHISVKIRKAIENAIVDFEGRQHKVTVSLGAALVLLPREPYTPKKLIEAADKQLYISKEKGRNCCSMIQLRTMPLKPQAIEPVTA